MVASIRNLFFCATLVLLPVLSSFGMNSKDGFCDSFPIINEYSRELVSSSGGVAKHIVTIEIYSPAACGLKGKTLTLRYGRNEINVDSTSWVGANYNSFTFFGESNSLNCDGCEEMILFSDGVAISKVSVPPAISNSQYAARNPDVIGGFALQQSSESSFGAKNTSLGPVMLITKDGHFPPRDSSPNASLVFRSKYWIFGGWGNYGHDIWYSVADVWNSPDGINWKIVSASPPYSPYSSFIVFQGRMWALGKSSFSSTDGLNWQEESLIFGETKRAVNFRDRIVGLIDSRVLQSSDGKTWDTLTDSVPWGAYRKEPAFFVHSDKLWVIGGTDEPGDGTLTYRNDVWSSSDGISWELVVANAVWTPRRWSNVISTGDKIWLINGYNHNIWPEGCGNVSDIWFSENGHDWKNFYSDHRWDPRHASFILPSIDGRGFLLAAGYGTCGLAWLYSDVWRVDSEFFRPTY